MLRRLRPSGTWNSNAEDGMPKATLKSGVKLHYQQVGEGPDLVMIHGLTGNLAVWHLKMIPML